MGNIWHGPLPESCRFRLLTGFGRNSADHTPPNSRAGQSRRRSAPRRPSPRVTLTPAPFVGDRAHRLWRAVLDPLHEGTVELEADAALGVQEAADVLRTAVAWGNGRRACDRAAVPIEIVQPRLIGLAFLSPELIEAILQGRQPVALTATRLTELDLPLDWTEQQKLLAG